MAKKLIAKTPIGYAGHLLSLATMFASTLLTRHLLPF